MIRADEGEDEDDDDDEDEDVCVNVTIFVSYETNSVQLNNSISVATFINYEAFNSVQC